ncbi:MAG: DUF424 family protein [Euryarchaeota archaeon]|nr:DUF424 family protein [Euryarchaeota archaeon]MDE1837528.1 DUF424 family protein [Euryarchaeota archaeon]MDE1880009.1 DUF424 family protein [Euryarchaeota archaeon]MDE2046162.1 DUF424 family protein [Thermoplasmata archaeon]
MGTGAPEGLGVAPGNGGSVAEHDLPPPRPGNVVLRVHRVRGEVVVAACDSELIETELQVGKCPVKVSSHFYGRIAVSEEEFVAQVRRGTIVNLLGARTIGWAVKAGLLAVEGAGSLGGVPHAEIVDLPA